MPDILRLLGDALSIVVLSVMWSITVTAWKQIPAHVLVPMQITGAKTTRVKKRMGLLFLPIVSTIFLLTPTSYRRRAQRHDHPERGDPVQPARLAGGGLGIMAIAHLRNVMVTLHAEGRHPGRTRDLNRALNARPRRP